MPGDPSLAIQGAILTRLKGNTDAGANVFDTVPASSPFPRITIGDSTTGGEYADCLELTETTLQVDVWSRAVGYPEAKRIASQVRSLLHGAELPLGNHLLKLIEFVSAVSLRDPDGLTRHVALTFRALTQPEEET